ncbi:MAG: hypothetical protein GQ574_04530 [Crocinitomix sp.]|nr:hypothetical protein [Crocinitomix sp.]
MELKLNISRHSAYPIGGFLITGSNPKNWLLEIQALNFQLNQVTIYPIPGNVPNSIWGCFVITNANIETGDLGKNEACQRVFPNLYIPEKSKLIPSVLASDYERHFSEKMHLLHPDFGLVEFNDDFKLIALFNVPKEQFVYTFKPAESTFIPAKIDRFEVRKVEGEDPLKKLEEKVVPKSEKLPDKPLNLKEKVKLKLYDKLFNRKKDKDGNETIAPTALLKGLSKLRGAFGSKKGSIDGMQQDLEDLEERNKAQVDRLLDMLKNNPDEALKYAVPLDQNGSSRGSNEGLFDISKRRNGFGLFGGMLGGLFGGLGSGGGAGGSGGGSVDIGDGFHRLSNQYHETARELLAKKEYEKAAFVYMKLLKQYGLAGDAMAQGGFYNEAAEIYLKFQNNKAKAAECYEKGKMMTEAIELYAELGQHEKVGDLYVGQNKRGLANEFYQKKVDEHHKGHFYVKAAAVYRHKMLQDEEAQQTLMQGWDENRQGYECLTTYLEHIPEKKRLAKINGVFREKVNDRNREEFLKVIHHEFKKKTQPEKESLKEIAYEIVAEQAKINSNIVEELRKFNTKDTEILKDTTRFKILKGKGKRR